MDDITEQLQDIVAQATKAVDQSASNLAIVTNIFNQASNLPSTTVPVMIMMYHSILVSFCFPNRLSPI